MCSGRQAALTLPALYGGTTIVPGGVFYRGLYNAVVPPPEEQATVAAADIAKVDHRLRLPAGGRPRAPHVGALSKSQRGDGNTQQAVQKCRWVQQQ